MRKGFSVNQRARSHSGLEQAVARSEVVTDEHVVCLVTSSGFTDERSLVRMLGDASMPLLDGFQEFSEAVQTSLPRPL